MLMSGMLMSGMLMTMPRIGCGTGIEMLTARRVPKGVRVMPATPQHGVSRERNERQ
ncbi:hypothetical protein RMSM_07787 [Rhodopirellula maiorica SM1]|uniref:Uncharacterized protein n=2 Tax=Novipirellula TaxID=2795426 RepID=M5RMW5_9BACT|nr:hypothetical protein RMSM_07787 [Rhodopirellula maiorica SM1]